MGNVLLLITAFLVAVVAVLVAVFLSAATDLNSYVSVTSANLVALVAAKPHSFFYSLVFVSTS